MELKVNEIVIPQKITFNFEELKNELITKVNDYKNLVYTDEQISFAKKDRATLNALKKALNDERIRMEREYMKPFEEFKNQVKELCSIIDEGASTIDAQVKQYEERIKETKANTIKEIWLFYGADEWMIRNDSKWLNASTSMTTIENAIKDHLAKVQKDLDTLDQLGVGYEAMKKYQTTLDINLAIKEENESKRIAEEKARWELEHSQMKIEEPIKNEISTPTSEIKRDWIGFEAYLSTEEAKKLGQYLKSNNISYRKPQNKGE